MIDSCCGIEAFKWCWYCACTYSVLLVVMSRYTAAVEVASVTSEYLAMFAIFLMSTEELVTHSTQYSWQKYDRSELCNDNLVPQVLLDFHCIHLIIYDGWVIVSHCDHPVMQKCAYLWLVKICSAFVFSFWVPQLQVLFLHQAQTCHNFVLRYKSVREISMITAMCWGLPRHFRKVLHLKLNTNVNFLNPFDFCSRIVEGKFVELSTLTVEHLMINAALIMVSSS